MVQVLFILACCALLLISGSFRVATIYHTALPDHDTAFYPLQVCTCPPALLPAWSGGRLAD